MTTQAPDNEHVILVAFHLTAPTRQAAEAYLTAGLKPMLTLQPRYVDRQIEEWWVAEDDRNDGSDNDPAVFCKPGMQSEASALLHQHGLTEEWNLR